MTFGSGGERDAAKNWADSSAPEPTSGREQTRSFTCDFSRSRSLEIQKVPGAECIRFPKLMIRSRRCMIILEPAHSRRKSWFDSETAEGAGGDRPVSFAIREGAIALPKEMLRIVASGMDRNPSMTALLPVMGAMT